MNKKTFCTLMGIVLLGAFFLPYFRENGNHHSGLAIVLHKELFGGDHQWLRFTLLLIPFSGIALLSQATEAGVYKKGLFQWLPAATIAFLILFANYSVHRQINEPTPGFGQMIINTIKASSYGMWITMAVAFLLTITEPSH